MVELGIIHDEGRFHAKTVHGEAELLYRIEGVKMTVYRTFVPEEDRHEGIAKALMDEAVKYADSNSLVIIPACEYANSYMGAKAKGDAGKDGVPHSPQ